MTPERREDARQWLDFAETDHEVAVFLYERHSPRPLEIICYHCQQAAEKAIKALYIALELPGGLPRKLDLTFLLNQMRGSIDIDPALRRKADTLSIYGVAARYPAEIPVDDDRTLQAIQYARAVVDWAKAAIEAQ